MDRRSRSGLVTLAVVLAASVLPRLAAAQGTPSQGTAAPGTATGSAAAPAATPPAAGESAAPAAEPPASPTISGYAPKAPRRADDAGKNERAPRPAAPHRAQGTSHRGATVASEPYFEVTKAGGTVFAVHLSKNASVEETKAKGHVTYLLKGVHVPKKNDRNPLVTLFWNTPVSDARLLNDGRDARFVMRMRADATPTWKVVNGEGGAASLVIEFPAGIYLSPTAPPPPPESRATPTAPPDGEEHDGDVEALPPPKPVAPPKKKASPAKKSPPPEVK